MTGSGHKTAGSLSLDLIARAASDQLATVLTRPIRHRRRTWPRSHRLRAQTRGDLGSCPHTHAHQPCSGSTSNRSAQGRAGGLTPLGEPRNQYTLLSTGQPAYQVCACSRLVWLMSLCLRRLVLTRHRSLHVKRIWIEQALCRAASRRTGPGTGRCARSGTVTRRASRLPPRTRSRRRRARRGCPLGRPESRRVAPRRR